MTRTRHVFGTPALSSSRSEYSLHGTTLTFQLDDGDGDAGTPMYVRTHGQQVQVANGAIIVVEPTDSGVSAMDSKIRLDSKSDGSTWTFRGRKTPLSPTTRRARRGTAQVPPPSRTRT